MRSARTWRRSTRRLPSISSCFRLINALRQSKLTSFSSARLAEVLRHQAALLEHIITDQRYYSDYFRVAFYGNFPNAIRNKQFIVSVFRNSGDPCINPLLETSTVDTNGRSLVLSASVCSTNIPVLSSSRPWGTLPSTSASATTNISNVPPLHLNPAASCLFSRIPMSLLRFGRTMSTGTGCLYLFLAVRPTIFYHCSAINLFSYSRPISKVARDGTEEVWIEKTYLTTEEYFPTVLRRSEVIGVQVVPVSPVETALLEVEQRTRELAGLNQKYSSLAKTAQHVSTNALAMSLNAAVDAPLNSGVGTFRQVFLSEGYVAKYPDRVEQVEKLRTAIDEQVSVPVMSHAVVLLTLRIRFV